MNSIKFDTGIQEYEVNNRGKLRMNPADPNLYSRFVQFCEGLQDLLASVQKELGEAKDTGALDGLVAADGKIKAQLAEVFPGNDFAALFEGVNLLGVTAGGTTVLENLLEAITPLLRNAAEERQAGIAARGKAARAAADTARKKRAGGRVAGVPVTGGAGAVTAGTVGVAKGTTAAGANG